MLYGKSGECKSWIAKDLGWHMALGRDWHGRRVKRAPVLYVALEGVGGFRDRMVTYTERLGDPGDWFARLAVPVSLDTSKAGAEGVRLILEAAKQLAETAGQPVGLIVIDTLARAIAGEGENEAEAIMAYLHKRVGIITEVTGAAVLTVHHENAQGGVRGSTALYAGCDFVLHAVNGSLVNQKTKDDATGPLFDYELEELHVGEDEDGQPITSCILKTRVPAPKQQQKDKADKPKAPSRSQKVFAEACDDVEWKAGTVPGTGEPGKTCDLDLLRAAFDRKYTTGHTNSEKAKAAAARRQAWKAATDSLPPRYKMVVDGDGNNVLWGR
jgi:hypothetical protein